MKKIVSIIVLASFLATLLLVPEAEARERGRRRNRSTTENSSATVSNDSRKGYYQEQAGRIREILAAAGEHRSQQWNQFANNAQNTVNNISNGVQTFIAEAPARRERRQEWISNNIVTPAVNTAGDVRQWASDHPAATAAISGLISGAVVLAIAGKDASAVTRGSSSGQLGD